MNLFDSHMHFCIEGRAVSLEELKTIKSAFLSRGILKIRDMGHKTGIGLMAKRLFENELTVETAGYALYKKGGYGAFLGIPIADKSEIKENVRLLHSKGVDFVKVINSGIVTTDPKNPISKGGFSFEELKLLVEEASALGLKVFCHANGDDNIRNALLAGVSSIEHGFFISKETILMLKERGVQWTPTVNALKSVTKFVSPEEGEYLNKVVENHLEMVRFAISQGVFINVGSDSGSKGIEHGTAFFEEWALLKDLVKAP